MSDELVVFVLGTTVYVYLTTTTLAGEAKTPTGSVKVQIKYKDGTEKVAITDMTEDATGEHSYYADTDGWTSGATAWYIVTTTSVDGSGDSAKTNICRSGFYLIP